MIKISLKIITLVAFSSLIWASPVRASGSISGTVKFAGDLPNIKILNMDLDPNCSAQRSESPKSDRLIIGEGLTLANVFVRIKAGLPENKSYAVPSEPVVVDQVGCMYIPHLVVAMQNQKVVYKNSDNTLHNVHGKPLKNKPFNIAMPALKKTHEHSYDQVEFEPFQTNCDVHPWMLGYVAILDHPYFSVTTERGTFKINDLPAGDYKIAFWHERLGEQEFDIKILEGKETSIDVSFRKPTNVSFLDAVLIKR